MLFQELELHACGASLARAYVTTPRQRLVKLGAWIQASTRCTILYLPQDVPGKGEWTRLAHALHATTTA